MDHYVSEFYKLMENCQVRDYAVFLEKKTGLSRINPFHVHEQLVVYITDKGTYGVRIRGMGEFGRPQRAGDLVLWFEDKMLISDVLDRKYTFVRKWKDGCTDSYWDFVQVAEGKQ